MSLAPARGAHPRFFDRFDHLTSRWDPFNTAYDPENDHVLDPAGPAYAAVVETHDHHLWATHTHLWDELIWPLTGSIRVTIDAQMIPVPLGDAVRVEAGRAHSVSASPGASVGFRWARTAPGPIAPAARLMAMPPLLRDTLLHLNTTVLDQGQRRRASAFADDLLRSAERTALPVPTITMPNDTRLRALCQHFTAHPESKDRIEDWAAQLHVSTRTLARQFHTELGTTFTQWRTTTRLALALTMLSDGASVTQTSHQLGYATVSAFTATFRKHFGQTPAKYASRTQHSR